MVNDKFGAVGKIIKVKGRFRMVDIEDVQGTRGESNMGRKWWTSHLVLCQSFISSSLWLRCAKASKKKFTKQISQWIFSEITFGLKKCLK